MHRESSGRSKPKSGRAPTRREAPAEGVDEGRAIQILAESSRIIYATKIGFWSIFRACAQRIALKRLQKGILKDFIQIGPPNGSIERRRSSRTLAIHRVCSLRTGDGVRRLVTRTDDADDHLLLLFLDSVRAVPGGVGLSTGMC